MLYTLYDKYFFIAWLFELLTYTAMQRSPIRDIEIKYVLRNALSDEVNNREFFMKGIDASYYYEGYTTYNTSDLDE